MVSALVIVTPLTPVVAALLILLAPSSRVIDQISRSGTLVTLLAAGTLVILGFGNSATPVEGHWYVDDAAASVFIAVSAVVGAVSAAMSPCYLQAMGPGMLPRRRGYYAGLHVFWATLLALPLMRNLGLAWITIEVSTGASALLVGFSGKASALEAGWKYLVLTTFGLAVALLGILVLYTSVAHGRVTLHALDFTAIGSAAHRISVTDATLAFVLITSGLAAKIGWAPVQNWLPDAHSEAPPAVSAMLSAALLPAVILVAWRTLAAISPGLHDEVGHDIFIAFGLCSLAVSIPFLWRRQAIKRLLAYSSLEHMGIIGLGIGFGSPLALAGVVLHVAAHALAKSLGFHATIPIQRCEPETHTVPAAGLCEANLTVACGFGISLGALSGIPPSPLFFSELLILLGGFQSGHAAVAVCATALVALGFLGLTHALIEGLIGERQGRRFTRGTDITATGVLCAVICCALLALSVCALLLPSWNVIHMLGRLG